MGVSSVTAQNLMDMFGFLPWQSRTELKIGDVVRTNIPVRCQSLAKVAPDQPITIIGKLEGEELNNVVAGFKLLGIPFHYWPNGRFYKALVE